MPAIITPTAEQQSGINKLAANLKTLRAAAGLSQEKLAGEIGVGRGTYINYETGRNPMPWNIYLAIMCFFLHNENTKALMAPLGLSIPSWPTT